MRRPARDRRLKPCTYCRRHYGVEHETRSNAECDLHNVYQLCRLHGVLDCTTREGGCLGSLKRGVHPDVPAAVVLGAMSDG